MLTTAKLFKTGHSQAVRLPKEFRLPGDEVLIRRNEVTGEVILTPIPAKPSLQAFFDLLDAAPMPEEFMSQRDNRPEFPPNPFEDWKE